MDTIGPVDDLIIETILHDMYTEGVPLYLTKAEKSEFHQLVKKELGKRYEK